MTGKMRHITDAELLMALDGELGAVRTKQVHVHLEACGDCRDRMASIEATSVEFAHAYRQSAPESNTDGVVARAVFRERLQQASGGKWIASWARELARSFAARGWAYSAAVAMVAALVVGVAYTQYWLTDSDGTIADVQAASLPLPNLTPGVAMTSTAQVCLDVPREGVTQIPVAERREVFREYGMDYRHADQYEVDHLITPALGGTDDIHNLWPDPYSGTEWNAHVKDQIEDLLHDMVCRGEIDLPTAQKAIATNWIAAYKHYFHTDHPLPNYSPLRLQGGVDGSAKS